MAKKIDKKSYEARCSKQKTQIILHLANCITEISQNKLQKQDLHRTRSYPLLPALTLSYSLLPAISFGIQHFYQTPKNADTKPKIDLDPYFLAKLSLAPLTLVLVDPPRSVKALKLRKRTEID